MADEQESIAEVEAETPIETEVETEQPVSLDDQPETEAVEEEAETTEEPEAVDDDEEEFDWNGKKVKGPKGLKDGLMMQADYTKKTQEVAATRKELEERAQRIEQQSKASEEEMNARAALIGIDADLKSYENVDWDKWEAEDLFAAQAGFRKYQQLQAARGQVVNYLGERQQTRTVEAQQATAKRLQETRQFAETQIKGWTPEVDAKVTEFATKELGFYWDTLKSAYTPAIYKALHLAWIGSQALNQKTPAKPTPAPAPLKVVAAKANVPARKSLGEMSMDEYVAARKAGRG
jgi:hypothetical protein